MTAPGLKPVHLESSQRFWFKLQSSQTNSQGSFDDLNHDPRDVPQVEQISTSVQSSPAHFVDMEAIGENLGHFSILRIGKKLVQPYMNQ